MAANTAPIYTRRGQLSTNQGTGMGAVLTTAAADYDGTGANNALVFTADPTNPSLCPRFRFKAKGTNTASVARFYLNNGSTNGTATNNSLVGEFSLPATTAIATAATADLTYVLDIPPLNAGWKIYVGLGTTVSAGWVCTPLGGDY